MNNFISPKYQMKLIKEVCDAIWAEYKSYKEVRYYIDKWHTEDRDWNYHSENFYICTKENGEIDLLATLNNIDEETLIKIAIDFGVDTPDLIPSIPSFKNLIKSEYKTASSIYEKAFKQIESHPDIAISLANSALESIIKEIFKDDRIQTKPKPGKTLYDLTSELLKEFQLFPDSDMPKEIKMIGSSLLNINQNIERLRSEKTNVHGKTSEEYIIEDSIYTYFIVNSVTTIGQFLISLYKNKMPTAILENETENDLPF